MEIKKAFGLLTLPVVALFATSCFGSSDVAKLVDGQCAEINQNKDSGDPWSGTASRREILNSGQRIQIAGIWFEPTGFGKLKQSGFLAGTSVVFSEGYITKDSIFGKGRYHFTTSNSEQGNKTILDVSCNCSDIK